MGLLTPLNRFRIAYHGARAHAAYRRGDISKAVAHFDRAPKQPAMSSLLKAFHATVLILDHRSAQARCVFQEVIEDLRAVPPERQTDNQRYVLNYCRFYVALIDKVDPDGFRAAACAASADSFTRRWLPLPG